MTASAHATAGGYQTPQSPADVEKLVTLTTFSLKLGGYMIILMTHSHIRDIMANLLREVCHDVKVEPQLQKVIEGDCLNPKTIIGDQARLDVSARGVWTTFDKSFLDICKRGSLLASKLF